MSNYAIGEHQFISLSGPPPGPAESLAVTSRAGCPGHTVVKTGNRGTAFSSVSVVNALTVIDGWGLVRQYEQLVGADPVMIRWGGRFEDQWQVQVLGVQPIQGGVRKLVIGVGGLWPSPSYAICRCRWELLPVELFAA